MPRLCDVFAGRVELTARQRAYVAHALEELYMRGSPGFRVEGNHREWHRAVVQAVLGPLELAQMVTPDGTALVTPEEHREQFESAPPAPSINTLRAEIEHEDAAIAEASRRLEDLVERLQLTCTHPQVAEAPHEPEGIITYARPPFRVCLTCGYAEETWGCGTIELGPRGRDAVELTRDQARAHVRGKPGAFILTNEQAVERARRLGRHGWRPR